MSESLIPEALFSPQMKKLDLRLAGRAILISISILEELEKFPATESRKQGFGIRK